MYTIPVWNEKAEVADESLVNITEIIRLPMIKLKDRK
jgi:hypothetical protein